MRDYQTCEAALAELAGGTRSSLRFPPGMEPPLPSFANLAEIWWIEELHNARETWTGRQEDVIKGILEVLESEGGPVVQEYMTWIADHVVPVEIPAGAAEGAILIAQFARVGRETPRPDCRPLMGCGPTPSKTWESGLRTAGCRTRWSL